MIALVPTAADAARLAVDGGEPVDRLHLTLWYLGKADQIPAENREAIISAVRAIVDEVELPHVRARGFGAGLWNPDGEQPAVVMQVGDVPDEQLGWPRQLADCRLLMEEAWHDGSGSLTLPRAHSPWSPHVCLAYSADPGLLGPVAERVGPVVFDRIRVAFADQVHDVPLLAPPMEGVGEQIRSVLLSLGFGSWPGPGKPRQHGDDKEADGAD